jgi:hypothetical protein
MVPPVESSEAVLPAPMLACVILAHTDPVHLRRLIDALHPFPVFLHVDQRTDDRVFAQMTDELPDRCTVLERRATGWARWQNVEAELAGYRLALAQTDATHVALLTGTDYPVMSTDAMSEVLARYPRRSLGWTRTLPYSRWGRSGGMSRLRYPHWTFRKHMIRVPVPRRIPSGVTPAGGSQLKVLARHHAEAVLRTADARPDLAAFWRRTWIADETFIPSILSTPAFVPGWADEHVAGYPWYIRWKASTKSPPFLGVDDLPALLSFDELELAYLPLFARKFATAYDTAVLDVIDRELRAVPLARAGD